MLQLLSALGIFGTALLLLVCLRTLRSRGPGAAAAGRFPLLERLLVWCAGLSFIALALSGFGVRITGRPLSGYMLLLHVGCGGVLAAAATLALLFLAPRYGFETAGPGVAGRFCCEARHVVFWLLSVALIGAMATPLAAMLPLLGTDGQEVLVWLHRLCGLAAVALALCFAYAEARLRQAKGV